ncbi:hypothetical protein GXW78_26750 [Roseomonas terrae]|uniref:Stress-induced protein n=1 Tax=Neoroseomonas terrae TaxID=424799 RepID=A0ABS5EQK3_9PROT|nr:hypothetical protein [Neoroseomonas terrae]MBR0653281.1 hypothetical protein [Neoroseomonas terrae]
MTKPKIPGSSRDGAIDARSGNASGKQADEVRSHAERAQEDKPATGRGKGEVPGALKDQTER